MIGLKENSQKTDRKGTGIMKENRYELNKQLAQMLKGGVIMDVTTPEQAKIAEEAGACAVMALERIPADIRAAGGVSRMSDPKMIKEIQREIAKFEKEFEDGGINFDIFSKEESSGEYTYIMYFYYGKEKYIVIGRSDEDRIQDIVIEYKNVILSHEGKLQ